MVDTFRVVLPTLNFFYQLKQNKTKRKRRDCILFFLISVPSGCFWSFLTEYFRRNSIWKPRIWLLFFLTGPIIFGAKLLNSESTEIPRFRGHQKKHKAFNIQSSPTETPGLTPLAVCTGQGGKWKATLHSFLSTGTDCVISTVWCTSLCILGLMNVAFISASHKMAICKLLQASLPVPGFCGGGQNLTGLDMLDKNCCI